MINKRGLGGSTGNNSRADQSDIELRGLSIPPTVQIRNQYDLRCTLLFGTARTNYRRQNGLREDEAPTVSALDV